jgi:ribose 5-phosphate isomerase A
MKSAITEWEKEHAAHQSVELVKSGMVVGLGSGATAAYMLHKLGAKVRRGLSLRGVPSSENTAKIARSAGIPLTTLDKAGRLDINIDGADEFDPGLRLIKGGGGALLREKILAHNSSCNVIIADSSKQVDNLGRFKLPLETIPFATATIIAELERMGLTPKLRHQDGKSYKTDEGNYVVDIDILGTKELKELNNLLIAIPGIVETGLFIGTTDILIMGKGDTTEVFRDNTRKHVGNKGGGT